MTRVGSALIGFLAATVIALATAWPAAAQDDEKPRWFGTTDGDTATLAYGVPDSDYVMLYFSCTVGKPVVTVYVQDEESRARAGASLRVRLSAGGARIAFADKALLNEDSGGKDVKGRLPLDDTLRRILTATDTLEIVVDGHKQRYAMDGAAKPAAALLAACDPRKQTGKLDGTATDTVPASFDCAKAGNAVETFICSQAALRWQDLALSRSYRAARNVAVGAADIPATARGSRDFLVWADDLGHGTIELKMRQRAAASPAYLVAWGSWELRRYLFDAERSQLVHAADTGIVVFDMATRGERRIAGTSQGDQPRAISADRRLLIWETRNPCGDKVLTEQDDSKPQRLCFAHLSKPEGGR